MVRRRPPSGNSIIREALIAEAEHLRYHFGTGPASDYLTGLRAGHPVVIDSGTLHRGLHRIKQLDAAHAFTYGQAGFGLTFLLDDLDELHELSSDRLRRLTQAKTHGTQPTQENP